MRSRTTVALSLLGGVLWMAACAQSGGGQEVTIYRDQSGVPHVFAETSEAVYYGGGYALAQDRLAEFERARRYALGRMSEIDSIWLDSDKRSRTVGYTAADTEAAFNSLTPEYQRMIRAHVAGMNLAIDEALADPENKMPYEFGVLWQVDLEHWSVHDYIATWAAHRRSLSSVGGRELLNLEFFNELVSRYGEQTARLIFDDVLPLQDPDALPTLAAGISIPQQLASAGKVETKGGLVADRESWQGKTALEDRQFAKLSTSTVNGYRAMLESEIQRRPKGESRSLLIGPELSASGNVLMLQATSDGPHIHYVGGGFDIYGYTRQGGGPQAMGRGPTHGWFQSTGQADMVDTFAEKLNPENQYQYWFNDAWHDMERRTEIIQVRDNEPVTFEAVRTVHGPVIAWDLDNHTAYTEQHAQEGLEIQDWVCSLEWGRSKSLAEFEAAVALCAASTNVQYGDQDGHIAHWNAGLRPIRPKGPDPRLPTPGTGEHEWLGRAPFAEWSKLKDPPEGYIHVWNNKPTADWEYGDHIRWGATFRNYQAHDLLKDRSSITLDDMKQINQQLGAGWGAGDRAAGPKFFLPYLKAAVAGDLRLEEAVQQMADWNAIYEDADKNGYYDHVGLTLWLKWLSVARELILVDDIGSWEENIVSSYRAAVLHRAIQGTDAGLPMKYDWFNGRDKDEVLRQSVAQTVELLTAEFGVADMTGWATAVFSKYYDLEALDNHPAGQPYGIISDQFSGWRGSTAAAVGLIPAVVPMNGSEQWNGLMEISSERRVVYDVSPAGGQNQFINLAGEGNPHIGDQLMLHVNFEFKEVLLRREDIAAAAESVTTLKLPAIE
jgi:penicillin amidase